MGSRLIECVPNFSEGRDPAVIGEIVNAMSAVPGAALLASESDPDHHRCVVTLAGYPEAVLEAAFRGVATAVSRIDLRNHSGVHPRIGAADVVPLVPLQNITLEECSELAHRLGEWIAQDLGVPVYFYEAAAKRRERRLLEAVRRGGFETLLRESVADPARAPDCGGPALHPTAGAVIVGARKFLLAFNVLLNTADVQVAKAIARRIRASSGGFPHVKAIGVFLASKQRAQVSMNLTDYEVTPLDAVFQAVIGHAAALGVEVVSSEIIGLMPAAALAGPGARALRAGNFTPHSILETRLLANLLDLPSSQEKPCPTAADS